MREEGMRTETHLRDDYDSAANTYDSYRFGTEGGRYTDQLEKDLLRRCLRKGSVLEVGVATGRFAIFLNSLGFDYAGIDLSRKMLELARKKARAQNWKPIILQMDAQYMHFQRSFDNVICVRTFHFLPKPLDALRSMGNSMNGNGRCLVTFETDNFPRRLALLMGLGKSEQRYYRREEVEEMLGVAGFRVLEEGSVFRLPVTLYRRSPRLLLSLLKRLDALWPWPVQEYVLGEHTSGDAERAESGGSSQKG